jgi:IS4 transposase
LQQKEKTKKREKAVMMISLRTMRLYNEKKLLPGSVVFVDKTNGAKMAPMLIAPLVALAVAVNVTLYHVNPKASSFSQARVAPTEIEGV